MSGSRKQIVEISPRLAEEVGAQQGVEVVDVEYVKERGEYFLRVYIDKPGGVTLDDCEAFSVVLGERLDEVDPIPNSYSLEISSPGIERPLKKEADFERFAGRRVAVRTYAPLDGRKNWKGVLHGLSDGHVVLEVDGQRVTIPLTSIAKAHLVAEW
ncbi:MAG: ribosome maturation factor RimP [Clostridia bacterium]